MCLCEKRRAFTRYVKSKRLWARIGTGRLKRLVILQKPSVCFYLNLERFNFSLAATCHAFPLLALSQKDDTVVLLFESNRLFDVQCLVRSYHILLLSRETSGNHNFMYYMYVVYSTRYTSCTVLCLLYCYEFWNFEDLILPPFFATHRGRDFPAHCRTPIAFNGKDSEGKLELSDFRWGFLQMSRVLSQLCRVLL